MDEDKNFPKEMFRGLSNDSYLIVKYVTSAAFQFESVNEVKRKDGYRELSITWNDDDEAKKIIMQQTKTNDNEIQFKAGIAVLNLDSFKRSLKCHLLSQTLKYERHPIDNNKYHGNILLKIWDDKQMNKQMEKLIQAGLVTIANENSVIKNEFYNK